MLVEAAIKIVNASKLESSVHAAVFCSILTEIKISQGPVIKMCCFFAQLRSRRRNNGPGLITSVNFDKPKRVPGNHLPTT